MLVSANVYERVVELRTSVDRGAAFILTEGDDDYLVTARHLFDDSRTQTVTLSNRFVRRTVTIELLTVSAAADVAVAPIDGFAVEELPLPATSDGLVFSQDLFFLGFPYGLANAPVDPSHRMALVKKATFSAMETIDGVKLIYLDGHNNPGFSGGPVVGCPPSSGRHQVCGVVSRYRTEEIQAAGMFASVVHVNTGIFVATDIAHVLQAIHAPR